MNIDLVKGVSAIGLVAVLSGGFLCRSCISNPIEFEVVSKETKTEKSGKSARGVYYIFTKNDEKTEVFQNTDNWLKGKFSSSDLHQKLEVGQRYKGTATGLRIPFISWYRNIIDADLVQTSGTGSVSNNKSISLQTLEGRFASTLLKMVQENPDMDVSEGIKAFSDFESVRDKQNSSKIKILGNKYQEKFLKSENIEAFKDTLKKDSEGKAISVLMKKQQTANSAIGKIMYYRMNNNLSAMA